jgi:uncharacterized protein (DUF433 family)
MADIREASDFIQGVPVTTNTINIRALKTTGAPTTRHSWTLFISATSIPYTRYKSPSNATTWYNWGVMTIDIKAIPAPLRFDAHGVCRVAGTRVTLLTLIEAFLEGATPEEIYQEYPTVSLAGVYTVIVFYLGNRDKIDGYLHTVREREARVVEEIKLRSPLSEIRRRLLPRKTQPA